MCPLCNAWWRGDFALKNGVCSATLCNTQRPRRRTRATVISTRYAVMFVCCRGRILQYALVTAVIYVSDWNKEYMGAANPNMDTTLDSAPALKAVWRPFTSRAPRHPAAGRFKMFFFSFNLCILFFRLEWSRGSVLAFCTQVRGFKHGRSLRIF